MRIYFDFNEDKYITKDDVMPGTDAKKIIDKVQSFVETRLKLLNDEIDKEQEGRIVIDMGKPEIKYYFSEQLATKMMESITEDDFRYIMTMAYFDLNQQ